MEELTEWACSNLMHWLDIESVTGRLYIFAPAEKLTEGSKSTKIERGTYFPFPASVKKVS